MVMLAGACCWCHYYEHKIFHFIFNAQLPQQNFFFTCLSFTLFFCWNILWFIFCCLVRPLFGVFFDLPLEFCMRHACGAIFRQSLDKQKAFKMSTSLSVAPSLAMSLLRAVGCLPHLQLLFLLAQCLPECQSNCACNMQNIFYASYADNRCPSLFPISITVQTNCCSKLNQS